MDGRSRNVRARLAVGLSATLAVGLLASPRRAAAEEQKASPVPEAAMTEAKAIFAIRCVACHGAAGKGDGAAAAALNPKPRDFEQRRLAEERHRRAHRQDHPGRRRRRRKEPDDGAEPGSREQAGRGARAPAARARSRSRGREEVGRRGVDGAGPYRLPLVQHDEAPRADQHHRSRGGDRGGVPRAGGPVSGLRHAHHRRHLGERRGERAQARRHGVARAARPRAATIAITRPARTTPTPT